MKKLSFVEKISLFILIVMGISLIGLQIKPLGWYVYFIGLVFLFFCRREFTKDMVLVYISMGLLGITPITTDISYSHMFLMGATLIAAVAVPYLISKYVYKEHLLKFRFHHGRNWYKSEIMYIFITAAICYFLIPFYLRDTGAYLNWSVEPGVSYITRLFIGTNALGIWDELFFVSTVLTIFRKYMSFNWANVLQAILFTSFLYELGFTGWWGPIMIYVFALVQGIVFKKTDSLFYVITIHLTLDLILFFALINAHHPTWVPFFIT